MPFLGLRTEAEDELEHLALVVPLHPNGSGTSPSIFLLIRFDHCPVEAGDLGRGNPVPLPCGLLSSLRHCDTGQGPVVTRGQSGPQSDIETFRRVIPSSSQAFMRRVPGSTLRSCRRRPSAPSVWAPALLGNAHQGAAVLERLELDGHRGLVAGGFRRASILGRAPLSAASQRRTISLVLPLRRPRPGRPRESRRNPMDRRPGLEADPCAAGGEILESFRDRRPPRTPRVPAWRRAL